MPNNSKTTSTLIIADSLAGPTRPQYARPDVRTGKNQPAAGRDTWRPAARRAAPGIRIAGLWQWRKAETKTNLQAELDTRSSSLPVAMPTIPADAESLRFRRVVIRGTFDASRQVLIDNRLHQEQAGYHVITPLRLEGSAMHVLVNRGWLPAAADHRILPQAAVPAGTIELTGIAVVPGQRFFNLAPQPASGWDPVWQNLDLERFRQVVTYPLQPVVIQLDAGSPGGMCANGRVPTSAPSATAAMPCNGSVSPRQASASGPISCSADHDERDAASRTP